MSCPAGQSLLFVHTTLILFPSPTDIHSVCLRPNDFGVPPFPPMFDEMNFGAPNVWLNRFTIFKFEKVMSHGLVLSVKWYFYHFIHIYIIDNITYSPNRINKLHFNQKYFIFLFVFSLIPTIYCSLLKNHINSIRY